MLVGIGRRRRSEDLVDLLLECHERIRKFSSLAVQLGSRSDVGAADVIESCQQCERYFVEALPLHVEDEEKTLLPLLIGSDPALDSALATMQQQHAAHAAPLAALLAALQALRADPGAVPHRAALHTSAVRVAGELEEHLKLEEKLVFPAIRARVSREAQQRAMQELRERRQPAAPHTP